jgi:hypothetical protein
VAFAPGATDIVSSQPLGAILNPCLANNGGPTRTHALVAGSPAIDAVTDGTCPPPITDQQGVRRPQDGNSDGGPAYDIGAYEFVFIGNTPLQAPLQPLASTPPQPKAAAPTQPVAPEPPPPAPTPSDQAITEPALPAPAPLSPDQGQTDETGQTDTTQLEPTTSKPISPDPVSGGQQLETTVWGVSPY